MPKIRMEDSEEQVNDYKKVQYKNEIKVFEYYTFCSDRQSLKSCTESHQIQLH